MLTAVAIGVLLQAVSALPTNAELYEAQAWAAVMLDAPVPATAGGYIEVIANHDPVQVNSRNGAPMRMGGIQYRRGVYCHAPSRLVVHLPGAAQRFEARVGVDSNEQTSGGRGSVVFSVEAAGAELWKSDLIREGMDPVDVALDLKGADTFTLIVAEDEDISCDQADWAEARVTLADGSTLWLSDLPLLGIQTRAYAPQPLFSFEYDGKPSGELLPNWTFTQSSHEIDANRSGHTRTWTDPKTGLAVHCEAVVYRDFPTVEWTLHFENTGSADTPILSNLQAIDTTFNPVAPKDHVLHWHTGDNCTADSYEPHADPLPKGTDRHFSSQGGRPTTGDFPYFNAEWLGEGLIAVVSWQGQWAAQFARQDDGALRIRAGQELTHFVLHPGERVRTPMIVLQFWKGDRDHAQNVWRAWMIAHNMPRPGGELPPFPQLAACSSHQYGEMINADSASQKFFIDKYLERGMKLDYWWMDAGWYWNKTGWPNTGTWEVDTDRFPGGLRPITDHAHSKDVDIIVWFEPERVTAGTWLATEHPEWIHGGKDGGLLDLGNPEARAWLTEHVDGLLNSEGIDLYRQDFNIDPLRFWRENDAPDRQGITEIRHAEGYLAYWDDLRRRHPDMLIDTCASGGRRNDLETLRRAVPLLRSDYIMEPNGNQAHTHALSMWYPFSGTGTSRTDAYDIYSVLCPHFIACWDMRPEDADYALYKRIIDQWRDYGQYFSGDYYAITPYTLDASDWIGWQFHRPDLDAGMIQVFRRSESIYESASLQCYGLDPAGEYEFTEINGVQEPATSNGRDAENTGIRIAIPQRPGVAILTYKRQ
jgi:alpha-galactosidase